MTEQFPGAPVHPADALAAEGNTITLADSRVVTLRYTMGSLRLLEARFGSLQGLDREVNLASNGKPCAAHQERPTLEGVVQRPTPGHGQALPGCEQCTPPGAMFTVLTDAIAPGLLHERVVHPDTNVSVRLGKEPEVLAELLDPARLGEYMTAWAAAFQQAMANLGGQGNGAGAAATSPSPGLPGTTAPQSSSAETTGPSGP